MKKSTTLRRRLAVTTLTALTVGAGVLATAPSAAAKANALTINRVSLQSPDVQVQLTYSCDPDLGTELVANATAIGGKTDGAVAAGILRENKLVCDYGDHTTKVTLHPVGGTHLAKGDKVKVAVYYFDRDGYSTADQTAVVVL
ncbi:hypothetical protein AB0C59_07680 [Streptomyces sp. NPDC048664]|uniref:hypothetical protein n=1 Tax=Streptomyces sp. NPDC048664 TaxID=3154505 RepID=UPI00342703DA